MGDDTAEVLSRPPLRVDDAATPESLAAEMEERLAALMEAHNGLEPTAEGWRRLAIELALQYVPAFQIETPADRTGPSGKGGKPVGFQTFAIRSAMKAEMATGRSKGEAAKIVGKSLGVEPGTARNATTRKSQAPDLLARHPYEMKAENALLLAADSLAHK